MKVIIPLILKQQNEGYKMKYRSKGDSEGILKDFNLAN